MSAWATYEPQTMKLAIAALSVALEMGVEVAGVTMGCDGTISIEFDRNNVTAELEAYPTGRFAAWIDRLDVDTEYWGVDGDRDSIQRGLKQIQAAMKARE